MRFDEPPVDGAGVLHPLAVLALADMMPGALFQRLGPDGDDWYGPSADFTYHPLAPGAGEWVLAVARLHASGDGYASLQMELWDESHTLLGFATQVMFFAFPAFLSLRAADY